MNILILGGAGKTGSSLATTLFELKPDINIRIVDNLSNGSLSNINHLHSNPGFDFYLGNICDPELMCAMMADRQVIINCVKSPSHEQAVYDIIGGSQNVLELLDENQQYIYIGMKGLSIDSVKNPTDASILSAEALAVAYWHQYGRKTLVICAPHNVHMGNLANTILAVIGNAISGVIHLPKEFEGCGR